MARCGCSSTCMCTIHGDGEGIRVLGGGSQSSPYIISPIIDPTSGNLLTSTPTGLRVDSESFPIVISDTSSVNLGGDGTVGTPLTAAVKVSPTPGNGASIEAGGLMVSTVGVPMFNPVLRTSSYTAEFGDVIDADATSASFAINLPDPADMPGGVISIVKVTSANLVNVHSVHSDPVDGSSSPIAMTTVWSRLTIVSTGTEWRRLGSNI